MAAESPSKRTLSLLFEVELALVLVIVVLPASTVLAAFALVLRHLSFGARESSTEEVSLGWRARQTTFSQSERQEKQAPVTLPATTQAAAPKPSAIRFAAACDLHFYKAKKKQNQTTTTQLMINITRRIPIGMIETTIIPANKKTQQRHNDNVFDYSF